MTNAPGGALLTEGQIIDLVALLERRGLSDALGYLLVATAYAMQGREVYPDWAELGREDRAAEVIGAVSGSM